MSAWRKTLNFLMPSRMMAFEQAEHLQRMYEAARPNDRYTGEQRHTNESPDGAMAGDAGNELRRFGRWLDENNDVVAGALNTWESEIVGSGIQIEPLVMTRGGEPVERINKKIRELMEPWWEAVDAARQYSMPEFQRLMVRSWPRDGEAFLWHVMGRDDYPFTRDDVPYTVVGLESEMCPQGLSEENPYIVMGVEKDRKWQIPSNYWMYPSHPGVNSAALGRLFPASSGGLVSLADVRPVPAEQISHLKYSERLNQTRGVSIFHSVINTIQDMKDGMESERLAMRISASMCAAIVRADVTPGDTGGVDGRRDFQMAGGMIFDKLQPGEDVKDIGTTRPNDQLVPFVDSHLRWVSGAIRMKYSAISNNFDHTYSAQRQELVQNRPQIEALQAHFISHVVRPMYRRFVTAAILDGKLTIPRNIAPESVYKAAYLTPALQWIDPKEVEFFIQENEAGLVSKSEIMARRGRNPREVREQLELELETDPTPEPATPTLAVDNSEEAA